MGYVANMTWMVTIPDSWGESLRIRVNMTSRCYVRSTYRGCIVCKHFISVFICSVNFPKISNTFWTVLDSAVAYEMMQGERRGTDINLLDFTYDGTVIKDVYLSGGLGQLTDGVEGQSNFRLDPHGLGIKGYDWIGWRNETFSGKPIEIIFKFDKCRNFTSVRIHCNNMFSKDVRVFQKAEIYFSVGGIYYTGEPIVFNYMRDILIEYARPVIIQLSHKVGKYVKIVLHFDARWLMVSEVVFESGKM